MTPRNKAIQFLKNAGYTDLIHGAKHDRYKNPTTGMAITLKRHDFNENDLNYIIREIKQNERRRG